MPQVGQVKPKQQRNLRVLVLVGTAVVVLVGGAYLYYRLVPSATTTAQQADDLDAQGSHKEAYDLLRSAYGRVLFNNDKITLLSRLAPDSDTLGKDDEALGYYTELDRLQPHKATTLLALGAVALKQGRKDVALSVYRQALELEKTGAQGPRTKYDIAGLTILVDQLEKQ